VRAVFVNHCHPDCPHVCGTRAREFANALARDGHRIVLLTETLRRDDAALDPAALPAALASHDWSTPFRLAVRPRRAPILQALRSGRMPAPLRAAVIAYQYLVRGGMFTDWRDASRPYWRPLAEGFTPDVTWGIFGNTDAWAIAQGIARAARCRWVRDLKDQWTGFIPAPLRRSVAARYADAAGTTGLSRANLDDAADTVSGTATVVYSGVPADRITPGAPAPLPESPFVVTLVGTVYSRDRLAAFADGVRRFATDVGARQIQVSYVGTDTETVRAAFDAAKAPIEIRGQLAFADYWRVIAQSHLNVYLRTPEQGWWHHKIVELLAVRRPLLCCPGEIEEARTLAASVGAVLEEAADARAVAASLERVWRQRLVPVSQNGPDLSTLGWMSRARTLLRVLEGAAGPQA